MRSLGPDAGARLLACGVALVFAAPLLAWLDAPVHRPQDEGLLLVYPDLMLRGLLPNRDFLASYPPGNFALLALTFQLFEPSILVERSVGFAYRIALILGIVALGNARSAATAGACGITAAVLLQPLRLEAFSWVGGLALVVWAAVACERRHSLLAGALAGAALSFRLDLALAAGLILVAHLWPKERSVSPRHLLLGFAVALAPLFVYFVVITPHNALRDLILDPIFQTGPARRLPLSSIGTNSLRVLLLLAAGAASALFAAWRSREFEASERASAWAIAGLCLGLLPQAFQRLDADHLIYAAVAAGGLLPVSLERLLDDRLAKTTILALCATIVITTAGSPALRLVAGSLEHATSNTATAWIDRNDRKLPARSYREIAAFGKLGHILDQQALPGERLFIGPNDLSRTNYSDLHLYFLFPELLPASYFIELNPKSANRPGTRLTTDLESASWLLLSREWDQWTELNTSSDPGDSRPNRVVHTFFDPIAQHGVWKLYRRREPR